MILVTVLTISALGIAQGDFTDGSFVGHINDTQAFVAIVTTGEKALAYICDGSQMAEWLRGFVAEDGAVELSSKNGWKLKATILDSGFGGAVVFGNGQPRAFVAMPTQNNAGLYRSENTLGDVKHVGGWIVDLNGEQRGAVIGGGSFQHTSDLDMEKLESTAPNLGLFTAHVITPSYVNENVKP